ncbi:signal peptide peptidase-like 3 isoform X1 [Papilio machaon]|uniref:signal peptide peptidase-like 3 isoform X1 n=1 Tax=Papilio machaon TaxID=76193 RepID=UPI0006EAE6C5|nr:signal peptide peptidase-like 3 isoform X1 [Papilio machaon]XP_045539118.1 signal peptide peptidase-like 3 isoform X1 [Papilio machaon]
MAQVGANMEYQEYKWAYSIMDSSKVSACLISMLLIVYGSFRSLNMEREARERAEREREATLLGGKPAPSCSHNSSFVPDVQTLNTMQALCFPLGSSVALLIMFFFFDSMQTLVAICTAIIACAALAFLLTPLCQYVAGSAGGAGGGARACGRYSAPELAAALLAAAIVAVWVLTGHWLLMDAMGMGLCVTFIALIRLPSLKVSTLLLTGLLLYDVFWVFFSSYIFTTNVMVKVATRPAENPMNVVARRLQLGGAMRDAPKLSLPAKLVFPSMHHQGHFSMLGLGDIVMPGLLLCFVLRYDAYKKATLVCQMGQVPGPRSMGSRLTYFHCSLLGYFLGLLTATVSAEVFKAAQPALLYLVPFTLLPLLTMAYVKGDLRRMWSEPFIAPNGKSGADFDV